LDLKELKEILQILEEKEITEFELEEEGLKLRVRKTVPNHASPPSAALSTVVSVPAPASMPASVEAASATAPAASAAVVEEPSSDLTIVKSPIVGTFYRTPDPNSPPFVNVGDHVRVGQVLCIIEAMKLMNEIEAEVAGEVVKIHHESGQPVQYGESLFAIRPER
jgi:acetyl-CoA carboxylase biotin carboxyl carrier protein